MAKRRSLLRSVRKALERPEGSALVPAAFATVGLLDLVPVPTDLAHFAWQKWIDEHRGELTPSQVWWHRTGAYFLPDAAFYLTLAGVTWRYGRTVSQQLAIGSSILATGALTTMLYKYAHSEELPK